MGGKLSVREHILCYGMRWGLLQSRQEGFRVGGGYSDWRNLIENTQNMRTGRTETKKLGNGVELEFALWQSTERDMLKQYIGTTGVYRWSCDDGRSE
jgi:hypothetical protein